MKKLFCIMSLSLITMTVSLEIAKQVNLDLESAKQVNFDDINVSIPVLDGVGVEPLPANDVANVQEVQRTFTNSADNSQISFTLYTSATDGGTVLALDNNATFTGSSFNNANPTKMLIHSYMPTGRDINPWTNGFRAALHGAIPAANIIVVDWVDASTANYYQASTNSKFVAQRVLLAMRYLMELKSLTGSQVHMFGHGIGAHIAGIAAAGFTGVAQITGFDPCGRQYQFLGNDQKLDSSDATFVDVIHTDDLGMGNSAASGHADIYFNGGFNQPGVNPSGFVIDPVVQTARLFFGGDGVVSNSHLSGIDYYQETITNAATTYNVFQATNFQTFILGESFGTKAQFGPAMPTSTAGAYFGSTFNASPYLSTDENYCAVKVGTLTRRLGGTHIMSIDNVPNTGDNTQIPLYSEGGILAAVTSGNLRNVIVLPVGKGATDYTYKFQYGISPEGSITLASMTVNMTGVTIFNPASTAGNCDSFAVPVGVETAAITLATGITCDDAPQNLDALSIGLITAAATAASASGLKLVSKLKKLIKNIAGKPLMGAIKVKKILKTGIVAMVMIKEAKILTFLKVKGLVKSVKSLPLKLGLIKLLAGPGSVILKLSKLKQFLKDISGLDKDNKNIVKKMLNLLSIGDNDSIFEKVIGGIIGALKL